MSIRAIAREREREAYVRDDESSLLFDGMWQAHDRTDRIDHSSDFALKVGGVVHHSQVGVSNPRIQNCNSIRC
jgi:hypothetical protein